MRACLACVAIGWCGPSLAAEPQFPSRPIKVIVPFSPGGSTDTFARLMKSAVEQQQLLPQPLVVVNLEGAGSTIGSRRVKNARPDGYTLLLLNEAIVSSKYWGSVPYGPEAFEPIAGTGEAGTVITVHEDSPYQSLDELLQDARQRPGEITAAVALGTPSHFACLLTQAALPGAEMRFAQIGGGQHRFAALKGQHVDLTSFSTDEFRRFRSDGLRGLAYLAERRNPDIPDVPTAREQGYDVLRSIMLYWWAPKGTPRDRLAVLAEAFRKAMQSDAVRQRLIDTSVAPVLLEGSALAARLQQVETEIASVDPRRTVDLPNVVPWTVAAVLLLGLWSALESGIVPRRPAAATEPPVRIGRLAAVAAATVLFVTALAAGWLPLGWAVAAFVLAAGLILGAADSRGQLLRLGLTTLVLAVGFHFLLTQVFVIDLPR